MGGRADQQYGSKGERTRWFCSEFSFVGVGLGWGAEEGVLFSLGRSFRCLELSGWRCWEGSRYTQTTASPAEESSRETSGCLQIVTEAVGVDVKSTECRELEARRRGSPAAEERQAHLVAGMNLSA